VASWLLIFLLSLASAKLQLPKLFNASDEIQTRNQPAVNNGLYQPIKSELGDYHRACGGVLLLLISCMTLSLAYCCGPSLR
jgi:hypothetical protein